MRRLLLIVVLSALTTPSPAEAQRISSGERLTDLHVWHALDASSARGADARATHARADDMPGRLQDDTDSLIEGAIVGGLVGGVLGALAYRGLERNAGDDPSTKGAIVGAVIGAAAGASVGMFVDHLLR